MAAGRIDAAGLVAAYKSVSEPWTPSFTALLRSIPMRWLRRMPWTPNARRAICGGRCTAFPILVKDNIETLDPMPDHGRIAGAGQQCHPSGRAGGGQAARRRRHHPGKNQSQRMGQYPLHPLDQWLVGDRRLDPQSLCPGSQHLRLQCRQRRGGGRKPGGCGAWNGDQWLAGLSRFLQWHCLAQADRRIGVAHPYRADFAHPGHGWADDAQRGRCGAVADGHGGQRSQRSRHKRQPTPAVPTIPPWAALRCRASGWA